MSIIVDVKDGIETNQSIEICTICDEPTGKAGKSEDSLCFILNGKQITPLCEECFEMLKQLDEIGETRDFEQVAKELKI